MVKVQLYNQEGQVIKDIELNDRIFNIEPKESVIHQVVVAQMANSRYNYAHTKDRSEVRGGGRKPWRQKGTGRARHGSIRSPLWIGGGVTFGPTKDRNFYKKVNKKVKRKALFMVLTDKILNNNCILINDLSLDRIKTKDLKSILSKLPIERKVLIVLPEQDEKIWKSARNLEGVNVILADSLNVVDILKSDKLLILEKSLEKIEQVYL